MKFVQVRGGGQVGLPFWLGRSGTYVKGTEIGTIVIKLGVVMLGKGLPDGGEVIGHVCFFVLFWDWCVTKCQFDLSCQAVPAPPLRQSAFWLFEKLFLNLCVSFSAIERLRPTAVFWSF